MKSRNIVQIIAAVAVSDGAGVKIKRSLGLNPQLRFDPFLMLDCFGSEQADDYIKGFPAHPHRGFETVTYMLDGHMLHEDHLGNQGHLKSGGVQWMTAGRGIIHSEMPQQEQGMMRGFQLWLNLPATEKMKPAAYVDISPEQIPQYHPAEGIEVKVIAGNFRFGKDNVSGPINGLSTEPQFYDIRLKTGTELTVALPAAHHAMLYPFDGELAVKKDDSLQQLKTHHAGLLSEGDSVTLRANTDVSLILLAGKPIGEPIAQYGPFVMNTPAEIEQAIRDYQQGQLTAAGPAGQIKLNTPA
ncbi:MAG: quercetin 2,3-dioxygenase [Rheinheimera sp.]|uniref:pirin family protein n=1 Tax=Arsukibacterium sp. UBA3155 TaxID=1946058 RepID=UPI000C8B67BC|nr:pirin family protein [Arsukibacterium sp. UBA3155]MAD75374.1 quercetin 2,3-dioxygenase [Rheinheimera sp.]|tara:strand:- start:199873 stop:200769 length:897 start_codon:yes stop_codon:yes gene_type:complete